MEKKNILIVEDHALTRFALVASLKDEEFIGEIYEAQEAYEGYKILSENKVDVILMDLGLPGVDGISATKEIRKNNKDVKIIVITSHNEEKEVQKCMQAGITVTSLPGAAACITALTLSGLGTRRFCFEGFLPADKKEKAEILEELREESRTIILYEAPHRLKKTLKELYDSAGNRRVTLCRELTKKFETILPTTLEDALIYYEKEEPRGEYVIVMEGKSRREKKEEEKMSWLEMPVEEHMTCYEKEGMDRKSAMKQVAKDRGITKREIYQYFLNK